MTTMMVFIGHEMTEISQKWLKNDIGGSELE